MARKQRSASPQLYVFSGVQPERFSARIAPQLVGLGLLEAIKEDDIKALADPNDLNGDGISGRISRISDPESGHTRLGRYGWKAEQATVRHQVASALNTDLGVMTSTFPHPDCGQAQTDCGTSGTELPEEHLNTLTVYLSLLGVRARRGLGRSPSHCVERHCLIRRDVSTACHVNTFDTTAYHPHAELQ